MLSWTKQCACTSNNKTPYSIDVNKGDNDCIPDQSKVHALISTKYMFTYHIVVTNVRAEQSVCIGLDKIASCTVEYIWLTIFTVYSVVQLGWNHIHNISKLKLHLNCKVLGFFKANKCTGNTHKN